MLLSSGYCRISEEVTEIHSLLFVPFQLAVEVTSL